MENLIERLEYLSNGVNDMVLFLSRKDVESTLTMDDAIEAVEGAFVEHGRGTVAMPLRTVIRMEKNKGLVIFMPAYIENMGALGIKVVSVYSDNPAKYNLPTTIGLIVLVDPRSGDILAIMDGSFLTAVRTGAVSAVATKYLGRKDARSIGIIGTGVQGRAQITALSKVVKLEAVTAFDVAGDRCKSFCKEISTELDIPATPVDAAEKAVRGSDIVVTSSTSKVPVLFGEWLKDGTHVNAIGSHTPEARELDFSVVKRAKIVVDSREAALKEAGDLIIPISQGLITSGYIHAELGEILTGKKAARENDQEITVFKSQGLAIQDMSTACKVYDNAIKQGIGTSLSV